jgi:hypothetical protein
VEEKTLRIGETGEMKGTSAENPPLATEPYIRFKYLEALGKPNPDVLPIVGESMGRRGRKAMVTTIMSRDRAKTREPENHTGAAESG